jgi:hypothetical protein
MGPAGTGRCLPRPIPRGESALQRRECAALSILHQTRTPGPVSSRAPPAPYRRERAENTEGHRPVSHGRCPSREPLILVSCRSVIPPVSMLPVTVPPVLPVSRRPPGLVHHDRARRIGNPPTRPPLSRASKHLRGFLLPSQTQIGLPLFTRGDSRITRLLFHPADKRVGFSWTGGARRRRRT